MRFRSCYALAVLAACHGEEPVEATGPDESGFLLVNRDALATRPILDNGTAVGAMPVALVGNRHTLALGQRMLTIDADASVLTYAQDGDGAHDTLIIGGDVYADRLAIEGDQAAVSRIAAELEATALASGDGRWILRGEDVWTRATKLDASGVTEVFPIMITNDGGVIAGTSAARAPATKVGPVPERVVIEPTTAPPPPAKAKCEDPLAGLWVARTYRTEAGDWHEFTLDLKRTSTGAVEGTIAVRAWAGESTSSAVSSCDDGSPAVTTGTMSAIGGWKGTKLWVDATELQSMTWACGHEQEYSLDRFNAKLRGDGALVATNNDGVNAHDRPYTFKRSRCE